MSALPAVALVKEGRSTCHCFSEDGDHVDRSREADSESIYPRE